MISFTVFKSIFDNNTDTRVDFDSFEKFEKALYHLSTLSGYKAKKGEFTKKASPLISPAIYKPGTTRANDNVIEWAGWAAIDVDNHVFEGNLKDELYSRFGSWYYICYSTASSTRDKPKFRLVFPLTSPVPAVSIKHFWYALNAEFGSIGDGQTKDLSRMYYVPAQYVCRRSSTSSASRFWTNGASRRGDGQRQPATTPDRRHHRRTRATNDESDVSARSPRPPVRR